MYVYTHDVPIDFDTYRKIIDTLGPAPLAGSLVHLCVRRPDGGLRYVEIWESEEACAAAFDDRIHPAVGQVLAGGVPTGEHRLEHLEVLHASGTLLDGKASAKRAA